MIRKAKFILYFFLFWLEKEHRLFFKSFWVTLAAATESTLRLLREASLQGIAPAAAPRHGALQFGLQTSDS